MGWFLQKDTDVNSTDSLWDTTTRILGLSGGDLNNFNIVTRKDNGCGAYSDNLSSDEGERSLGDDTPPPGESARGSRNIIVLDKRTRVFPVSETDPGTEMSATKRLCPG
jgi:hypothetical protein